MDSFDDVIRQHLDLKRRRGANPREVAELEREALGAEPFEQEGLGPRLEARRSQLSQDTVEIDMEAVIGAARMKPPANERHAYDWSADAARDIADPASDFAWETPLRVHLRGAA